jgi:CheY-like chemotaxis protein
MPLRTLLIIDDSPERYRDFVPAAQARGYVVHLTHDPYVVETHLAHPHPQAPIVGVLLDHDMPTWDGAAFAVHCFAERALPVLITSANDWGALRIERILIEYGVPTHRMPALGVDAAWIDRALGWFERQRV